MTENANTTEEVQNVEEAEVVEETTQEAPQPPQHPMPVVNGFRVKDATGVTFRLVTQPDVTPYESHLISMMFISILALSVPQWDIIGFIKTFKLERHFEVVQENNPATEPVEEEQEETKES
jgi:hypothetical protein